MNAQTLTKSAMSLNFLVAPSEATSPLESPILISSRDYGFDFDEAELARELLAPLPTLAGASISSGTQTDEFEPALQYYFA